MKNKLLSFVVLFLFAYAAFSQQTDSTKKIYDISGSVTVTNNGISLVPNFSLSKPAIIAILSAGQGRFSFDSDIRFSLSAKPWTILFWGKYKLIQTGRLRLSTGAHLGLNFKISTLPVNGDSSETNVVRRYLAGELVPNYFITKSISVGLYYLYAHGLDAGTVKNTHFFVVNTSFSNIKIFNQFFARVIPQVYYLKQDMYQGFYFISFLSLERKNFPLSVSCLINQKLSGDIVGGRDFIWSAGLVYSFNKKYIQKPAGLLNYY